MREPLILFVVGGAALYFVWTWVAPTDVETVRIEAAALRGMEARQVELLGRALTDDERAELVAGYVDDEVLLREALRQGLHMSDFRARQRLIRIKRASLTDTVPEPSVAQLQAHFRENLERYTTPKSVTLVQVMFPWGEDADTAAVLKKLRAGANPDEFGTTSMTAGRKVPRATRADLVVRFGADFADAIEKLPEGGWHGPIESLHGIHLVRVGERHPEHVPLFEEVESYLRQEWMMTGTRGRQQERIDEIRAKYRIEFVDE